MAGQPADSRNQENQVLPVYSGIAQTRITRVLRIEAEYAAQREKTVAQPQPRTISGSSRHEPVLVNGFYVRQPVLRQAVQNIQCGRRLQPRGIGH